MVQGTVEENLVSDIGSPGPFSVSTRMGVMMALLGSKRATFTELLFGSEKSEELAKQESWDSRRSRIHQATEGLLACNGTKNDY